MTGYPPAPGFTGERKKRQEEAELTIHGDIRSSNYIGRKDIIQNPFTSAATSGSKIAYPYGDKNEVYGFSESDCVFTLSEGVKRQSAMIINPQKHGLPVISSLNSFRPDLYGGELMLSACLVFSGVSKSTANPFIELDANSGLAITSSGAKSANYPSKHYAHSRDKIVGYAPPVHCSGQFTQKALAKPTGVHEQIPIPLKPLDPGDIKNYMKDLLLTELEDPKKPTGAYPVNTNCHSPCTSIFNMKKHSKYDLKKAISAIATVGLRILHDRKIISLNTTKNAAPSPSTVSGARFTLMLSSEPRLPSSTSDSSSTNGEEITFSVPSDFDMKKSREDNAVTSLIQKFSFPSSLSDKSNITAFKEIESQLIKALDKRANRLMLISSSHMALAGFFAITSEIYYKKRETDEGIKLKQKSDESKQKAKNLIVLIGQIISVLRNCAALAISMPSGLIFANRTDYDSAVEILSVSDAIVDVEEHQNEKTVGLFAKVNKALTEKGYITVIDITAVIANYFAEFFRLTNIIRKIFLFVIFRRKSNSDQSLESKIEVLNNLASIFQDDIFKSTITSKLTTGIALYEDQVHDEVDVSIVEQNVRDLESINRELGKLKTTVVDETDKYIGNNIAEDALAATTDEPAGERLIEKDIEKYRIAEVSIPTASTLNIPPLNRVRLVRASSTSTATTNAKGVMGLNILLKDTLKKNYVDVKFSPDFHGQSVTQKIIALREFELTISLLFGLLKTSQREVIENISDDVFKSVFSGLYFSRDKLTNQEYLPGYSKEKLVETTIKPNSASNQYNNSSTLVMSDEVRSALKSIVDGYSGFEKALVLYPRTLGDDVVAMLLKRTASDYAMKMDIGKKIDVWLYCTQYLY
jgi:hypothetical protein